MKAQVSIGIVGLGQRGVRYAEVFTGLRDSEVRWICDVDTRRLVMVERYPRAAATDSLDEMLADASLDAVVVAGPLPDRVGFVRAAIEMGKHVFVEGPISTVAADSFDLASLARERGRCLFIGSGVLFDPALRKLREIIETGQLGTIVHLHATHTMLADGKSTLDVLWTLGARDVAAILYLVDETPVTVSASGESYLHPDHADVVVCLVQFASGVNARLHLSRLDPQTARRITLVGSRRMAVHDGTVAAPGLTLYEHSISPPPVAARTGKIRIRPGDVLSPALPDDEPDDVMCQTFLAAVRRGRPLDAETRLATNIASVLEALELSLDAGGAPHPVLLDAHRFRNVVAIDRARTAPSTRAMT